jgi:allantoate deiminase
MEPLGMAVRIDAAGNLRAIYPGQDDSRRLVIGSHLDTVPDAGAYDGVLGVVLAIALIESLEGRRVAFEIEVVGFSEEEGVRFGFPFIGSRALNGTLDEELLAARDPKGTSVQDAIRHFGLDPARIADAILPSSAFAYLEFHIEQGPVLDHAGQPLGVVEAIAGQSRATLEFRGIAGHAGTTPMPLRRDALAGAAEWISAVEQHAAGDSGLVATVGKLEVNPGAGNVIPGTVIASLDVRHASDEVRRSAVAHYLSAAARIAQRRDLTIESRIKLDRASVAMHPGLVSLAARSLEQSGYSAPRLVSGAGHDAMVLAGSLPAAMIFLRSPGGVSHHPSESVYPEDIAAALHAGLHLLSQLELSSV